MNSRESYGERSSSVSSSTSGAGTSTGDSGGVSGNFGLSGGVSNVDEVPGKFSVSHDADVDFLLPPLTAEFC